LEQFVDSQEEEILGLDRENCPSESKVDKGTRIVQRRTPRHFDDYRFPGSGRKPPHPKRELVMEKDDHPGRAQVLAQPTSRLNDSIGRQEEQGLWRQVEGLGLESDDDQIGASSRWSGRPFGKTASHAQFLRGSERPVKNAE